MERLLVRKVINVEGVHHRKGIITINPQWHDLTETWHHLQYFSDVLKLENITYTITVSPHVMFDNKHVDDWFRQVNCAAVREILAVSRREFEAESIEINGWLPTAVSSGGRK